MGDTIHIAFPGLYQQYRFLFLIHHAFGLRRHKKTCGNPDVRPVFPGPQQEHWFPKKLFSLFPIIHRPMRSQHKKFRAANRQNQLLFERTLTVHLTQEWASSLNRKSTSLHQ